MMGTLVVKRLRDTISLPKELFLFFQVALIEDVENILCGINEGLRINKINKACAKLFLFMGFSLLTVFLLG